MFRPYKTDDDTQPVSLLASLHRISAQLASVLAVEAKQTTAPPDVHHALRDAQECLHQAIAGLEQSYPKTKE